MKKILFLVMVLVVAAFDAGADEAQRMHRYDLFRMLPIDSNAIVFVGNSITEMFNWNEVFVPKAPYHICNRGVSGATSDEVLHHVGEWAQGHPHLMVLMIGTNDLGVGCSPQYVADNVAEVVMRVKQVSPKTRILLHGLLPSTAGGRSLADEQTTNRLLRLLADSAGITFIDLWQPMLGLVEDASMSLDRLHLTAKGYAIWCRAIKAYIGDLVDEFDSMGVYRHTAPSLGGSSAMRAAYFSYYPQSCDDLLFFGDEMVKCGEWHELTGNPHIRNRAVGWAYEDAAPTMERTMAAVEASLCGPRGVGTCSQPWGSILYTGTGEVNSTMNLDSVEQRYLRLVERILAAKPTSPLYVVSLMPTAQPNMRVVRFNQWLQRLSATYSQVRFVDIYSSLVLDSVGNPAFFAGDYLMGEGYRLVARLIGSAVALPYDRDFSTLSDIQQRRTPSRNSFWLSVSNSLVLSPVPALGHWIYGQRRGDNDYRLGAAELGASWLLTLGVTSVVKMAVRRPRPYQSYPAELFCLQPVRDPSFPSGHTSLCFATATTLSLMYPKWYVAVPAYLWAAGVGYSRLYVGAHYPTDVVTGAIVGVGCAVLAHVVRQYLARQNPTYWLMADVVTVPLTMRF